ncbi:hypothetical protein [Azospirillum doebereinerae]
MANPAARAGVAGRGDGSRRVLWIDQADARGAGLTRAAIRRGRRPA